jgi:CxxC-x17-CxxC domain-containing protein
MNPSILLPASPAFAVGREPSTLPFPENGLVLEFADRILQCADCAADFVFSAGEQAFFHDKQYTHDPRHCKQCRAKRMARPKIGIETRVNCAECGIETTVPFKPTKGLPVLCHMCFRKLRRSA